MKRLALRPDAIPRARRLRCDVTPQERKLWRALRENFPEAHFRKQVPMGIYTADFAWHTAKLIIEVDGGQHGTDAGKAHDAVRTEFLESEGYRVLRFWNNDVDRNLEGVLTIIANVLNETAQDFSAADAAGPHPNPPHKGEGILESVECPC
jgi:very-short-patch-repair endonuclease